MSGKTNKVKVAAVAALLANSPTLFNEWRLFYGSLSMKTNKKHDFEAKYGNDSFNLFNAILEQFVGDKGSGATIEFLSHVLDKMGQKDAAEKLTKNFGATCVTFGGDADEEEDLTPGSKFSGLPESCTLLVAPVPVASAASQTPEAFLDQVNAEKQARIEVAQANYIQCFVDLQGAKRLRKWIEDHKTLYRIPVMKDILTGILGKTSNPAKMFDHKFDEAKYFGDWNPVNVEVETFQHQFTEAERKLNEAKNSLF